MWSSLSQFIGERLVRTNLTVLVFDNRAFSGRNRHKSKDSHKHADEGRSEDERPEDHHIDDLELFRILPAHDKRRDPTAPANRKVDLLPRLLQLTGYIDLAPQADKAQREGDAKYRYGESGVHF